MVLCFYVSFYSLCERVNIFPHVVGWQRRLKSSAEQRNVEVAELERQTLLQ